MNYTASTLYESSPSPRLSPELLEQMNQLMAEFNRNVMNVPDVYVMTEAVNQRLKEYTTDGRIEQHAVEFPGIMGGTPIEVYSTELESLKRCMKLKSEGKRVTMIKE